MMLASRVVRHFRSSKEGVVTSVEAYLDLSNAVYQLGRLDEAADLLTRALEAAEGLDEDDPRIGRVLNKLGVLRERQGRHSEAERMLKRSVAALERITPLLRHDLATAHSNLGVVYRAMDRPEQARAAFDRAVKLIEPLTGEPELPLAWTLDLIGDLEASEGNHSNALFALRRSLAIKERVTGPDNWDVSVTLDRLAEVYFKQGRYNEAETFLLRVVAIRERVLGWDDPAMARPLMRLARLYHRQRKTGRAEQLVGYALKLFSEVLPPTHDEVIGCLHLLAEVYQGLSRYADADAVLELARGLLDGTEGAKKIRRFVFPTPPRISGPSAPLLEPGAAG